MARRATKVVGVPRSPRVKYPAFGALLKELRGSRSVEQVLKLMGKQRPAIRATQGTVSGYEQGYTKKVDAVTLWGLARAYGVSLEGLVAALHACRQDPRIVLDDCRRILHLQRYNHGPSPEMAKAALKKAAHRVFDAAAEIETLQSKLIPHADDETEPR